MDEHDEGPQVKAMMVWVIRLSGAAIVIGTIWGFVVEYEASLSSLGKAIATGLGLGLLVYLTGLILSIVISGALEFASDHRNPFSQGLAFAIMFVALIGVFDLILLRATFIVVPAFTILTTGGLGDSYWGCRDDWVSVEEGSFCDR